MKSGFHTSLGALLLLVLFVLSLALPDAKRELKRSDAKKWQRIADVSRLKARSAARQYLEDSSSELVVPIEVEVVLVGFDGDGGYGYHLDSTRLLNMLSSHLGWYCPYSWETEEELGVCMHVNFQVIGPADNPAVSTLLVQMEDHLRKNLKQSHTAYDEKLATGQRTFYTVEASEMEPMFDRFMLSLYGQDEDRGAPAGTNDLGGVTGTGSVITGGLYNSKRAGEWHKHNTIFVINPSKVRINPAKGQEPAALQHQAPKFIELWQLGQYDPAQLADEEAGFVYRYAYNGAGEAATWFSSRNYLVVDLAAGPTTYGPLISQGGAVTPQGLPSIKDTYVELMDQLNNLDQQITLREAGRQAAEHGLHTLLAGRLAAVLAAGVKAAFIPDMATQHLEQAKTVLVPVVVLTDYAVTADSAVSLTHDNYFGINATLIETALAHLIGEGQEAVVMTTHYELHAHKQLAAALYKATRTHSDAVVDMDEGKEYQGHYLGMHVNSHTFIDPEVLMQEIELSADMLTNGLVTVAHTMGKEDEHHIAQLRHEGTRVVPVFVLVLSNHPEDVVLSNRELVAANHDAVVVLQLAQGNKWGGPNDFFTGHMANGKRVVIDGTKTTRHIIAGLAQSLAGVVPPYQHFEPALNKLEYDWRWACGASPFGPYSNYSGVSEIMQNAARRNALLSHVSAALRQLQHQLDAVDAFVGHHFKGPWEAAGMKDAHRHWLDTVASTRHGFNTTLDTNIVFKLESALANISTMIAELSMDMFTHDFKSADDTVSNSLLPSVASLCTELDHHLDAAEEVMQCCRVGSTSFVTQTLLLIWACAGGAAVFFVLVGVALCARFAKQKAVKSLGLPTYGLPMYSGKSGTWSF